MDKKKKLLIINENTVIRLYTQIEILGFPQTKLSAMVVDKIIAKLSKSSTPHPLKELFLDENDRGPFYELVHFVFLTIDNFVKTQRNSQNIQ